MQVSVPNLCFYEEEPAEEPAEEPLYDVNGDDEYAHLYDTDASEEEDIGSFGEWVDKLSVAVDRSDGFIQMWERGR